MALIIDGYNLLNATGITGRGRGAGSLERSRTALLNFIVASVEPSQHSRTKVVFDAGENSPPGLPQELEHGGVTVLFAKNYQDADALIEELIQQDNAPRQLTVVSSDHRLQRAARRRRANFVDSEDWYREMMQRRRRPSGGRQSATGKPTLPLSDQEVDYWLSEFGEIQTDQGGPSLSNPFPPGYGEDVQEEDVT